MSRGTTCLFGYNKTWQTRSPAVFPVWKKGTTSVSLTVGIVQSGAARRPVDVCWENRDVSITSRTAHSIPTKRLLSPARPQWPEWKVWAGVVRLSHGWQNRASPTATLEDKQTCYFSVDSGHDMRPVQKLHTHSHSAGTGVNNFPYVCVHTVYLCLRDSACICMNVAVCVSSKEHRTD